MDKLLSTRQVAQFLGVNEKMVYNLVADKGLPATKVTGKWLFPRHLVEQWVETNTINYPRFHGKAPDTQGLLVISGSNDPLLERTIALFNKRNPGQMTVFGNVGSMGGLQALRRNHCHIAASHLLQDDSDDYNFEFASQELDQAPAMVNFCRREQGLLVAGGNPKGIKLVADLAQPNLRIANRPLGTGTRLLLDRELKRCGINGTTIKGYQREFGRHLDVGLEVLAGRADVAPGIRAVANILGLEFVPLRWERFDLLIAKERFFDEAIQRFLSLLHEAPVAELAQAIGGYDLKYSGMMIYPGDGLEK